jgi:RNA-directed DNA polymerase
VFHPTKEGVEKARQVIETWLQGIGLELKPSKTRIAHTLEGEAGFNFLGMNVRQYPVGKTHSGKNASGNRLGFKTLIKPSKEAIKRHITELAQIIRENQAASQEKLIEELNRVIKGWTYYYRTVVASEAFAYCDNQLYSMLRRWARFRHPNKSAKWIARKYWSFGQGHGWVFQASDDSTLRKHIATNIKRHVKVRGKASPYDGELPYWAQRLKEHPMFGTRIGILLKGQRGRCAYCGLNFKPGDLMEIDHRIPLHLSGEDRLTNLQILHRHCHDQKTATEDVQLAQIMAGVPMTGAV